MKWLNGRMSAGGCGNKMSHKVLWKKYWKTRSDDDRNNLVMAYIQLARHTCHRLLATLPQQVNFEEIFGAACEGLIKAIEKYDERQASFPTYANLRMRGCILDYLRLIDPQQRQVRIFEKQQQTLMDHAAACNEQLSDEDLRTKLKVSKDLFQRRQQEIRLGNALQLMPEAGPSIVDPDVRRPEDLAHYICLLEDLIAEQRSEKAKIVLHMYFHEGLYCKDIAEHLGVTESRVSQLKNAAVAAGREKYAA
jgi:RNA polymerase sigma factor for flagellar operon FliA